MVKTIKGLVENHHAKGLVENHHAKGLVGSILPYR